MSTTLIVTLQDGKLAVVACKLPIILFSCTQVLALPTSMSIHAHNIPKLDSWHQWMNDDGAMEFLVSSASFFSFLKTWLVFLHSCVFLSSFVTLNIKMKSKLVIYTFLLAILYCDVLPQCKFVQKVAKNLKLKNYWSGIAKN